MAGQLRRSETLSCLNAEGRAIPTHRPNCRVPSLGQKEQRASLPSLGAMQCSVGSASRCGVTPRPRGQIASGRPRPRKAGTLCDARDRPRRSVSHKEPRRQNDRAEHWRLPPLSVEGRGSQINLPKPAAEERTDQSPVQKERTAMEVPKLPPRFAWHSGLCWMGHHHRRPSSA